MSGRKKQEVDLRVGRHPVLGDMRKGREVFILVDGRRLPAREGELLAAALYAAGIRRTRYSGKRGEPRGPFCMVGRCTECLMTVDGVGNVRACVTSVKEGMRVETPGRERKGGEAGDPRSGRADAGPEAAGFTEAENALSGKGFPYERRELVVVGGGPAGLCAASQASQAGADVLVLDEADRGGGQLCKQIHRFFGSREHGAGKRGYQIAEELSGECRASGAELRLSSPVLGFFPAGELMVDGPDGIYLLKARATILCTGAAEKSLPFPGWTLPGVMGAGAAQTLVNIHGVLPGRRILMVGSGNVGLIVAYQLLQAGAEVVGIVEAGEKVGGYLVHLDRVRREGIPIYLNHRLLAAEGGEEVESVMVESVKDGKVLRFRADCVCLAVGMTPQVELAVMRGCRMLYAPALGGFVPWHDTYMRTSVEGVFTAGDSAGVEEASVAMEEGRMAGLAACEYLGRLGGRSAERKKREVLRRLEMLRGGERGREKARPKAVLRD